MKQKPNNPLAVQCTHSVLQLESHLWMVALTVMINQLHRPTMTSPERLIAMLGLVTLLFPPTPLISVLLEISVLLSALVLFLLLHPVLLVLSQQLEEPEIIVTPAQLDHTVFKVKKCLLDALRRNIVLPGAQPN